MSGPVCPRMPKRKGGRHAFGPNAHAIEARARPTPRTPTSKLKYPRVQRSIDTLEPCSSQGKTPPCVERILASGVRCVVVGALDPDPRHGGAGLSSLRERGVEVVLLEGASPLSAVAPHFNSWIDQERLRRPRPWTIAKWAQTRTGQLIPPSGVGGGRWISGPESLKEVQVLRGRVDAIVSGVGTVLADDPRFTVRPPGDPSRPPWKIVFDSYLRT